jgi:uncharacterized protein YcfJ
MRKGCQNIKGSTLALVVTAGVLAASGAAASNPPSSYYVSAPVVHVEPIYVRRTIDHPVRQCTESQDYRYDYDSRYERDSHHRESYLVPSLFGGIVGGLIGNQFGGGNGKKALTVVGALAGSSIARDAARRRDYRPRTPTRVCRTSYTSETVDEINAYDVTYEYQGQQFSKRMSEHPGDSVRVRVQLSPAF